VRVKQIQAAGTVVVRDGRDGPEVLLVHRPRYDDWSLPKGKLAKGEYLPACAVRETREETGLVVRLGVPLDEITYQVNDNEKAVCYWRAEVLRSNGKRVGDEVDKVRWLPVEKAIAKVSYPEEPALIRQAVAMPATLPVLVVRHGKALHRSEWSEPDPVRPLNERGELQSRDLIGLLDAYGVTRLASSTSTRCIQTLEPFARARQLPIDGWAALSEEDAAADLPGVVSLMERLAEQVISGNEPLAICGHRPVLPTMLESLGIAKRLLRPGAAMIAHLTVDGSAFAVEHRSTLR
jgi:8-oxo-dGTP diphosphatase